MNWSVGYVQIGRPRSAGLVGPFALTARATSIDPVVPIRQRRRRGSKAICETCVRYGCRRVHVVLDREGWRHSIKKNYSVYRDMGMQLGNKTPKRRVKAKLREDRAEAVGPNDVWAMDFVFDQLALGQKLRILTVVDTHSRFLPRFR